MSSSPTKNLWLNTLAANYAAAATSPNILTYTTNQEEGAAVPADDAEEDDSTTVEKPGLNTGGDTTEGASHVQKLQHWKQKIEDMQGMSVEIKLKNQVVKWTVIGDEDPPISHGPPERPNLGIQDFDYDNIPRDEVFARMFFHLMWIGIDEQLIKFNTAIDKHNESLPVSHQKIKIFSKSEIILGYAFFVAAAGFS
jgi:hypothetical protein